MQQILSELKVDSNGEGLINITHYLKQWIRTNRIEKGILVLSSKHTSCSLIINENADPKVLEDLSTYFKSLVPERGFQLLPKPPGPSAVPIT